MTTKRLTIQTASVGLNNPGIISAVAIVTAHSHTGGKDIQEIVLVEDTTLPKSELKSVIAALESIPEGFPGPISIQSSSRYLVLGYLQWRVRWALKGWKGTANRPLWERLCEVVGNRDVAFNFVRTRSTKESKAAVTLARKALIASSEAVHA
ncbi:RNase H family protein [Aureimonas sp. Leaf454]|uniref:ribonuclease HI n=1 Tax=Aureimonas sp. Leaf454 TaxID=1736381 RepID=UPI0009E8F5E7|nr:RNase H family protein [Aureimonas sp. Leaf454]